MQLTVGNVLELDLLREARAEVVAGRGSLSRPVRWVHISEQPDVARYLKGGELLLTTGMGLGMNEALQAKYVADLADVGIAGLVVRLGGTWKTPPARLVAEARARQLPLIVLRHRIGFIQLTELVHGAIISRQLELLTKAESIGRGFTELMVRGAGLSEILHRLAGIVQNPVVLEDPAHQVIEFAVHTGSPTEVLDAWENHSRTGHVGTEAAAVHTTDTFPRCLWANVWLREAQWGRLHVLERDRHLDEIDGLALDRAVASVALALLNEAEADRLAGHAVDSLIADIMDDTYGGASAFYRRAVTCRADFRGRTLAVAVMAPQSTAALTGAGEQPESDRQTVRRRLLQETQRAVEAHEAVALCGLDADSVLAIIGLPADADVHEVMEAVGREWCSRVCAWLEGIAPVVGVSSECSPDQLRHAFDQALESVEYGRGRGAPRVVHFSDLGLQHLLLRLSEGPELARFVEGELSGLLDYDVRRRARLLETLRVYLDCGCRKTRAARLLSIERRSLYHRLDRIGQVLCADLDDDDTRLRLTLALRGLELLEQRSAVRWDAECPTTVVAQEHATRRRTHSRNSRSGRA